MATATAVRKPRAPEAWAERCVELARAAHLDGTPSWLGQYTHSEGRPHCWRVPSRDRSTTYTIEVEASGVVRCHCRAAEFGNPCAHAGAAILAERARDRGMAPRTPAQQSRNEYFAQQWAALGNHGAVRRVREEW
jgi:hypothetical protein